MADKAQLLLERAVETVSKDAVSYSSYIRPKDAVKQVVNNGVEFRGPGNIDSFRHPMQGLASETVGVEFKNEVQR
jgi:hypothetical protein